MADDIMPQQGEATRIAGQLKDFIKYQFDRVVEGQKQAAAKAPSSSPPASPESVLGGKTPDAIARQAVASLGKFDYMLALVNKRLPDYHKATARYHEGWDKTLGQGTRIVDNAMRSVARFGMGLAGVPATMAGVLEKSIRTGQPNAVRTLEGSFDLVAIQLSGVFMPALLKAAEALQDFAKYLEERGIGGAVEDQVSGGFPQVAKSMEKARREQEAMAANMEAAMRKAGVTVGELFKEGILDWEKWTRVEKNLPGSVGDFKADLTPPGFQAGYSGLDDARRGVQTAALQNSQLQIELLRQQLEQQKKTAMEVAIMNRMRALAQFPQR